VALEPIRTFPKFGAGWGPVERQEHEEWRWMQKRSTTLLPPARPRANLRIQFDVPDELMALEKASWGYMRDKNYDGMKNFLADDGLLIFWDGTRYNKRQTLELMKDYKLDSFTIEPTYAVRLLTPDAATLLYRVTYTGNEPTAAIDPHDAEGAGAMFRVSTLDLAQSALLAGLPQAPTDYNPFVPAYVSAARARRTAVLQAMVRSNYISQAQASTAEAEAHAFSGGVAILEGQRDIRNSGSIVLEHDADADDADPYDANGDHIEVLPPPETIGGGDHENGDDQRERHMPPRFLRNYKIQEVIRRRQILLVQVVKEERGISSEMALRLARYFGTTPEFWINLQAHYDLSISRRVAEDRIKRDVRPMAEVK